MVYLLAFISVVTVSAAQLLLKRRLLSVGPYPENLSELAPFFLRAYTNAYVIGAVLLTIIAALAWILATTRAQLSLLYPFMALSFVLVALFCLIIFKEDVSAIRWVGIAVICLGVFLVSRS